MTPTPETPTLSERMLEEAYVGGIAGWDDMIDEVASLEKRLEAAEKQAAMFVGSDLGAALAGEKP